VIAHIAPAAPGRPTVLVLHGRGASNRQLLPLLRAADRSVGIIAPRGEVTAGHGFSWCRRHAMGVPCPQDLLRHAGALGRWLDGTLDGQGAERPLPVVGYSSGAIMAMALAALRPDLVAALALLRGVYPLPAVLAHHGLRGMPVLVSEGEEDDLLSASRCAAGIAILRAAGARVETVRYPGVGHGLCLSDARDLRAWLARFPVDRQGAPPLARAHAQSA
jgi:phospholipase/carboxylesterase